MAHGIKFYGFTVVGRTKKLKSVNFYYCVAKILGGSLAWPDPVKCSVKINGLATRD